MLSSSSSPSDLSGPLLRVERFGGGATSAGATSPDAASRAATERDDDVICAACARPITSERARIERFGGHVHERVNLAGVAFEIGLFDVAPGARLVGESSGDFPFFPHHRWTIAICGGCFSHLGWRFESGTERSFFGLSLSALRSRGS